MIFTTATLSSLVGVPLFYPLAWGECKRGAWPQAYPETWRAAIPSSSAVRAQGLIAEASAVGVGAVSARNCSTAATIAADSDAEAPVEIISIRGRGGLRSPFRLIRRDSNLPGDAPGSRLRR
jgi:hypothetical protein